MCARSLTLTAALTILLAASSHLPLTAAHTTTLATPWAPGKCSACQCCGNQKNYDFAHCFHDEVLGKKYEKLPSASHAAPPTAAAGSATASAAPHGRTPLAGFEASAIGMTHHRVRTSRRRRPEISGRQIIGLGANEGGRRRQDVLRQGKIQRPVQRFASGRRKGLPPGGRGQQQHNKEGG